MLGAGLVFQGVDGTLGSATVLSDAKEVAILMGSYAHTLSSKGTYPEAQMGRRTPD